MEQKTLKPSAIMRLTGARRKALRLYEDKFLITAPCRTHTGQRVYPPRVLEEVRFIRGALEVGFHLRDVKPALETWRKGGSVCPYRAYTSAGSMKSRSASKICRASMPGLRLSPASQGLPSRTTASVPPSPALLPPAVSLWHPLISFLSCGRGLGEGEKNALATVILERVLQGTKCAPTPRILVEPVEGVYS